MKRITALAATAAAAMLLLAGCSAGNPAAPTSNSAKTIAFLMPCSTCADRFESKDKPYFIEAVHKLDPSIRVIANNAQGNQATQITQAESALTNGASVIVTSPFTAQAGATIVEKAKANNASVIAYDGMIDGASPDAYVSFENEKVGEMQGQYLLDHLKPGATVVEINGDITSAPGLAFKQGAHKVLDPAFASGKLKLGYESDTAGWDGAKAQASMEQALTTLGNKVDGVLAPNDGLATPIIAALTAQGLNGKVLVTGQDATDPGLTNILAGNQSMTVYKSIHDEANAAAKLAVALAHGDKNAIKSLTTTAVKNDAGSVPAIILTPVSVDKSNIADTVIKDGFTTWTKICVGAAASACPSK
ncbi:MULTISPECIES: substrate-binding domain-containing protein [unclassified Leifsonia]|uniref:sugar ABC transporter substrate-binding protein n=1 Tax=unclassified Leifsonia TaxID=2663824 RepID=UPI0008A782F2|nr:MULTISPECIES: substrate-binding domain-containing protein [unclassified Leifsonia]SEI14650.1 monosaccharide ABC transporter substrate-binding protein, CUT2 family [Leifsonia sp. CL154]SFM02336.1 monosaccharide ABC transporter substrate-binding protein, CUT2 family [Leifsonia sp. CL147]